MPTLEELLRTKLTEEQYNTVMDDSNEVLCLACAGSGKSRTLSYKIIRLIAEGESPKNIVAFTFTEKAAETIKRRVGDALSIAGMNPSIMGSMYIGTIHSYCKYLLGEVNAKYRQFDVLDENRLKLYLISRYGQLDIRSLRNANSSRYFKCIKKVANAWCTLNDEVLNLADIERENKILGNVLNRLNKNMIKDGYMDFSLMIRMVVDKINKNDTDMKSTIENIKYLLVDEYQDINPAQENLIRGIHEVSSCKIFVLGDDDQSIFGWRGADVNNILEFQDRYHECGPHTLSVNYRSVAAIINLSTDFVRQKLGAMRINKNPTACTENENKPYQIGKLWFNNREEEADWVASRISHIIGKSFEEKDGTVRGLCPSDIAILMASTNTREQNGECRHTAFTRALEDQNISYSIEAQGSIFNSHLANVLRETFEQLRDGRLDRFLLRTFFNTRIRQYFQNAIFNEVAQVMTTWRRLIHDPIPSGRRKISPQQLLYDLLNAFHVYETDFNDVEMQVLGIFSKIMEDIEAVYVSIDTTDRFQEILNFLQNIAEEGYDLSPDEVLQRPNAVFVSTIHKAKGLEFPVVFIVDVEQGRVPGRCSSYRGWLPKNLLTEALNRGRYQNTPEGDIRLFYTAITRAERYLYISGSENLPNASSQRRQSSFVFVLSHSDIIKDQNILPASITDVPKDQVVQRIDETIMPTSFSEIKYYLSCPKRYQFRNQYGFQAPVPEMFGFGLTTHTAIGRLHQLFTQQLPSEDDAEKITKGTFNLKHTFKSNDPENSPGPYERALNKSVEVVKDYIQNYGDDFINEKQVEVRFEIPAQKTIITGSIDLLLKEDNKGNIVETEVIDFKSMDEPEKDKSLDWTDLAIQVQLYAKAAKEVLGENAQTGSVHLLRDNKRVNIPINKEAMGAAIKNIEWSVDRIINRDYPMRPHKRKCDLCDFRIICPKKLQKFNTTELPSSIHLPATVSFVPILCKSFSEVET